MHIDIPSTQHSHDSNRHACNLRRKWSPGPLDWFSFNVDASMLKNSHRAGLAIIVRDCTGKYVAAKSLVISARDIDQAEALAVLEGLQWAQQMQCGKLILQTDNQGNAVAVRNYNKHSRREDVNLINQIKKLISSHPRWIVTYVNRVCNGPADKLAKYVRKSGVTKGWYNNNPHNVIRRQLLLDSSQVLYFTFI
ncbi:uncharacterized protein LOC113294861 [Papaver somniferum]|uniref:uncharacterized protein LOC113294861 n=1 Tax=Papaver somniferum TaxID=3469 RepID=UPI000E70245D|nr:uncharacterized protein LOC113294861 [Papaver somniferum]